MIIGTEIGGRPEDPLADAAVIAEIEAAEAAAAADVIATEAAEGGDVTIGEISAGSDPETMRHLTND